jgi:hypothetical protein
MPAGLMPRPKLLAICCKSRVTWPNVAYCAEST